MNNVLLVSSMVFKYSLLLGYHPKMIFWLEAKVSLLFCNFICLILFKMTVFPVGPNTPLPKVRLRAEWNDDCSVSCFLFIPTMPFTSLFVLGLLEQRLATSRVWDRTGPQQLEESAACFGWSIEDVHSLSCQVPPGSCHLPCSVFPLQLLVISR